MSDSTRLSIEFLGRFGKNPAKSVIKQIISLYRSEGWWSQTQDNPELVLGIIQGSHCFLTINLRQREIIGMGRAISDGVSDAYIQDVTVRKDMRKRGIGTIIVNSLVDRLQSNGLHWIGLIAEKNSRDFYTRIGFNEMPNSAPMLKLL